MAVITEIRFSDFCHAKGVALLKSFSYGVFKPEVKTLAFEVSFNLSDLEVINHDSANYMG